MSSDGHPLLRGADSRIERGKPVNPGDLVAFRTRGFYAGVIKAGQRIGELGFWRYWFYAIRAIREGWPDSLWWCEYTHIAWVENVMSAGGAIIVQAVKRIDRVLLSTYEQAGISYITLPYPWPDPHLQAGIVNASVMIGKRYGLLTIFFDGLNYITPKWIRITGERKGRMNCAVLGARIWEHMGYSFPRDIDTWLITPGWLVKYFYKED